MEPFPVFGELPSKLRSEGKVKNRKNARYLIYEHTLDKEKILTFHQFSSKDFCLSQIFNNCEISKRCLSIMSSQKSSVGYQQTHK